MSIYSVPNIGEQPKIRLSRWKVIRDVKSGEDHFIGHANREGRVSSAIQKFDSKSRTGVTHSGRIYILEGESGACTDAAYVWEWWSKYNGITKTKDVSKEYA